MNLYPLIDYDHLYLLNQLYICNHRQSLILNEYILFRLQVPTLKHDFSNHKNVYI